MNANRWNVVIRHACRASVLAGLLIFAVLPTVHAAATSGTMYFTTFAGGFNVHKVTFAYDGTSSFTLGLVSNIAATPGADGLVFTSDNKLAVGGQGGFVYKVDPGAFNSFTSVTAGGTLAFHMMVAPNGTIYSSSIPGTPASYTSTLSANGVAHPLTGDDTAIDTIIWPDATDSNHAVYTSSGAGGFGSIGFLDLTTFTTTRVASGVAAAHGGAYDPFSNSIVLFGDSHITQFDPVTLLPIAGGDLNLGALGVNLDQGAVDGKGHIFAADNNGKLVFLDIAGTGLVGSASFTASPFLAAALDDIAPLTGAGSNPAPEPATLALLGLGLAGLAASRRRKLN